MLINLTWKFNPDNSDLSEAEVGDRLLIQADDAWKYRVRADALPECRFIMAKSRASLVRLLFSSYALHLQLLSDYKGLPICQAKTVHDELQSNSSWSWSLDHRVGRRVAEGAKGADWTNYNRSFMQP